MPLKPKNPQTQSEIAPLTDKLSGPWGKIGSQEVVVLRLVKRISPSASETYSYPYRVLSSWRWRGDSIVEELKIEAGPDLVTVTGRGLDRIVEALDANSLEILSEALTDNLDPKNPIGISSIVITPIK